MKAWSMSFIRQILFVSLMIFKRLFLIYFFYWYLQNPTVNDQFKELVLNIPNFVWRIEKVNSTMTFQQLRRTLQVFIDIPLKCKVNFFYIYYLIQALFWETDQHNKWSLLIGNMEVSYRNSVHRIYI